MALLCCLSAGCAASGDNRAARPKRVSPDTASAQIAKAQPPSGSRAGDALRVIESTPDGLFESLATQTFRLQTGINANDTYAVTADQAVQLGTGYDGPGIIGFHLGDIDRNGEPDVAYAFGSGSGVTRYEVGVYDRPGDALRGQSRTRRVPLSYRNPLRFEESDDGLEVWDQPRDELLGLIRADSSGELRFTPATPLSRGVRDRLLEPRLR